MQRILPLTTENLSRNDLREQLKAIDPSIQLVPEETHCASIRALLDQRPVKNGVWIFAYGSLIWNPLFDFEDSRPATLRGYHRRYCLWSKLGRGTPEFPGLTLGLDRGGNCRGVAYFIPEDRSMTELETIWRREMVTDAYEPRLAKVIIDGRPTVAIAFITNRRCVAYVRDIPDDQIVATIAKARGQFGDCASYLLSTVEHLNRWGIRDPTLERLKTKVLAEQKTRQPDRGEIIP